MTAALLGGLAACATEPAKRAGLADVPAGYQRLRVSVMGHAVPMNAPAHLAVGAANALYEPLADVRCVLRNDKGAWQVDAPGEVTVALSGAPLTMECRKEGYQPASGRAPCETPRTRARREGTRAGLLLFQMAGPALVFAAPAAIVGAAVAAAGAGAAVGSAAGSGPGDGICDYSPTGQLWLFLWPEAGPGGAIP